jgi:glucuronoarabinoxylan endo-1,4-beta-xylanase
LRRCRIVRWTRDRIIDSTSTVHFFALELARALSVVCCLTLAGCSGYVVRQSAGSGSTQAPIATVNWTNVHQIIDGFGAADAQTGSSLTTSQQSFLFGTGSGQLGLSLLRVGVTDGVGDPGDCTSVSASCAGVYISDMQAMIANGGRVYATPWSPPAAYKTNGNIDCTAGSGSGALISEDYGAYATWMANFVESLSAEDNIHLYAISVQNEPDQCHDYDSALWTAAQIDSFVTTNLGPTFASNNLSTLILMPENGGYAALTGANGGGSCGTDSACANYVGGYNWHDYDASLNGTNTVTAAPYPSGWSAGKKYWETEASCGPGYGPNFCQSGYNTGITDALDWAAIIDQRLVGDGANAWLYWWLYEGSATDDQSLISDSTPYPQRAYMLGQYSKFVRPGYYRIDATHNPQTGVSVSAYQNTSTGSLVIIATNYTGSAASQQFNIIDAPAFSSVTPTITSASLNLATQSSVPVSSNSFTYTLPADSITTFVGGP